MYIAKPFTIAKSIVLDAYRLVKANHGSAGVDAESLEEFEKNLKPNLYKIWNRLSSGSYFPPPVKAVEIPKKSGGIRILGVPTVADRVAQMVVKLILEPKIEPCFLDDSYGYRPGKSAIDAIGVTRKRCWKYLWLIEFDIKYIDGPIVASKKLAARLILSFKDGLIIMHDLQGQQYESRGSRTVV